MRMSQYPINTNKETPAEADVLSHQLMLRAGMVRRVAAGIYTWLPMGLKVMRKVENVVREEMNRAGALEMLMPAVQPAELGRSRTAGRRTARNCSGSRTGTSAISSSGRPMRK